ncbi:hypothetical protein REPUB_Repub02eG0208900 [Reevesia pubescens]
MLQQQLQQHQHHLQSAVTVAPPPSTATLTPPSSTTGEAPPKQVALAMDRLGHAARLIADIRLGADRLLEALFVAAQPHQSSKPLHLFRQEDESMRQHLQEQDLRTVGRQLEESGVLNESLRSRSNSWGLHMPLVCPDGAVVADAWKRQLAGQAGASAVDRTRAAATYMLEVLRSIMYLVTLRSMLLSPSSISSASEVKLHCILFCTGSAAIKLYLPKSAANVDDYWQWTGNLLCSCLLSIVLIELFLRQNFHRLNPFPQ